MPHLALPYTHMLRLTGPDTIILLERLVTCRVDDMAIGDHRPGALLTPQGKIIADFYVTRTGHGCDLRTHYEIAPSLEKRLKLFRLRADVEITSTALETVTKTDHTARVDAGLPIYGEDFTTADVFPTDINLDIRGGIDYKKGCFVGQEVVSRMKRRGKIRKRSITLKGNNLKTGEPVMAEGKRLGFITSATETNALAILRIDYLASALGDQVRLTSAEIPISPALPEWLQIEMEALINGDT